MAAPAFPQYSILGLANDVVITAAQNGNGDFSFVLRSNPTAPPMQANVADVLYDGTRLNTVSRTAVNNTGRLTLTQAKASYLRIGGLPYVISNAQNVPIGRDPRDQRWASPYYCVVRSVNGYNVTLAIQDRPGHFVERTLDWTNPVYVWTGSETRIALSPGQTGTVYLHDAFLYQDPSFTATGKWPDGLAGAAKRDLKIVGWVTQPLVIVRKQGQGKPDQETLMVLPLGGHHVESDFDPHTPNWQHDKDVHPDLLAAFGE